jgi:hypothetical protein
MATSYSPKIITDGLVFMYDTDDGKSYKGEPTTNLNTFTLSDSGTDGSGQSSVGTRTVITDNYVRIVDVASNTRQTHVITGLTASTTYTVSIMYKKLVGTPTFRFQIQDYSGSSYLRTIKFTNTSEIGIEDKEGWQLASWTFTLGSDANAVRIWYQDGADYTTYTHSFELQNPQLEAKSHATPYVDGTRSATQGLLDRTGNTTIDLSNASFDSNAQMTFDGTNDYAEVADQNSLDLTTAMSFEFVVKPDSSQSNPYPRLIDKSVYLLHLTSTSPFGVYQNIYTSGGLRQTGISSVVTAGNWSHIVCTYDGQYGKIYVDAELVKTRDFGSVLACNTNSSSLKIAGDGTTNRPLNGEMPISKIYNKVLTASEVLQNYNATKGRFGL